MQSNMLQTSYTLAIRYWMPIVAIIVSFLAINTEIDAFDLGVWALDYQNGFIKRGLAGSIIGSILNIPYEISSLTLIFICIYLITAAIVLAFLISKNISRSAAFVIFSSGFLIQQLGSTIGKFDPLLISLTIISLNIILISQKTTSLIPILLISIIAMLIHEGAALLCIPLIFCSLIVKSLHQRRGMLEPFLYVVISATVFSIILVANSRSAISGAEYIAMGQLKIPGLEADNDAFRLFKLSLTDNIHWAISKLKDPVTPSRIALTFIAGLPFIFILINYYRQLQKIIPYLWLPVAITISASSSLYLLGIDFSRWNAWILTNTFLILLVSAKVTETKLITPKYLVAIGFLVLLWSGPFGVTVALPERGNLLKALIDLLTLSS